MNSISTISISLCSLLFFVPKTSLHAQVDMFFQDRIRVVNIVPNNQSGESWQDSEPNIAVDPSNTNRIIASAFTRHPTLTNITAAPIYVSSDRGNTWEHNYIVPTGPIPFSVSAMTFDISLKFNDSGGRLYTGILRGGAPQRTMDILTVNDPFNNNLMNVVSTRVSPDQPWVKVKSTVVGGNNVDRVYVSNNDLGAPGTQTATIDFSANGLGNNPAFNPIVIEIRNPTGQDSPPVRTTVHNDGTVYGTYFSRTARNGVNRIGDVIVVRDDNWGTSANPFQALIDPTDNIAGVRVVTGSNMPFTSNGLGNERIGGSMDIVVDPNNSQTIYVVWGERIGAADHTLRVRRSTDGGQNWSNDLITITNAVTPSLAINSDGDVGFLYQALVASGGNQNWETHFRKSVDDGVNWRDYTLAVFQDGSIARQFWPYLGDYADLMAVGKTFYGIFSSGNVPNNNNFPNGITYQRNANFNTNTLTDNLGNNVVASIDPFFFSVSEFFADVVFLDFCDRFPGLCQPLDICTRFPKICIEPIFEPGKIIIECPDFPCYFIDPIQKNCLVKWECPGCDGGTVMCPPYHHIFLEDFDPRIWMVEITSKDGEPIKHQLHRIDNGVVLTFRPNERLYKENKLDNYVLGFATIKKSQQQKFTFNTRLEVSDYRFPEYVTKNKLEIKYERIK